ncbi:hypothetical protein [Terasakiella sp.]|uniref:hypothetical protein n=1 Tax=Terasakiella sp. TaxID=2034861 RepID=UPI003AA98D79
MMSSSVIEALVNAISVSGLVICEALAVLFGMETYFSQEFGFAGPIDYTIKAGIILLVGFYGLKFARHIWKVERGIIKSVQ